MLFDLFTVSVCCTIGLTRFVENIVDTLERGSGQIAVEEERDGLAGFTGYAT